MSKGSAIVEVEHLTKIFRAPMTRRKVAAVVDLNLEVREGEVYGLLGPNGSGKSTTMKVILGLISATRGTTRVFGVDSSRVASREAVGFLPENPYFYKYLSGRETLQFYGKLCGLSRAQLRERIPLLLHQVDLETAADRAIGSYSKGMLQRIGMAQALIHEPRLVVLDEPTAGVDPRGSRKIRDFILQLKESGMSVILSSHLLEQVQEVCDRVGILFNGRMVCEGSLSDLTEIREQTSYVISGGEDQADQLVDEIRALAQRHAARLERVEKPRTTLERLYLDQTKGDDEVDEI